MKIADPKLKSKSRVTFDPETKDGEAEPSLWLDQVEKDLRERLRIDDNLDVSSDKSRNERLKDSYDYVMGGTKRTNSTSNSTNNDQSRFQPSVRNMNTITGCNENFSFNLSFWYF